MGFLSGFFEFPIKVHDQKAIKEALRKAKQDGEDIVDEEPTWVSGKARVHMSDISGWTEDGGEEFEPEDRTDHFDITIVNTFSGRVFECLWTKKKFEKEIEASYIKYCEEQA